MTDADTAAAIESLAYRLRQRDEAIRNGTEYPDAEPFAQDFLAAMIGKGWRHLEALAPPRAAAADPDAGRRAELLAEARARCAESPTRVHPAEKGAA